MSDLLMRLDEAANDTHYIDHITAREAAGRICALEAQLAAPVAVRVKPLVWREDGPEWPNCFHAVTNVGRYEIGPYNKGTFSCHVEPQMRDIGLSFLSPDEAKAAAQADYEARILSAIESVPVAEVWRRAIEAAAMVAGVGTFPITGRYDDLTPAAQARAMVSAYTPTVAEAIADRMGDMVRAALGEVRPVQPDITGPLHDSDDQTAASYEIDPVPPFDGWRAMRRIGFAAGLALLAWGFWIAANWTMDAVERQIEAGAAEW